MCIPVPLFHCFGSVMGSLAAIAHGATAVYPAGVDGCLFYLQANIAGFHCTIKSAPLRPCIHNVPQSASMRAPRWRRCSRSAAPACTVCQPCLLPSSSSQSELGCTYVGLQPAWLCLKLVGGGTCRLLLLPATALAQWLRAAFSGAPCPACSRNSSVAAPAH